MKTILVIEDEPELLDILEMVLSNEGFQVITMRKAEDALEFCRVNRLDLILSDVRMGSLDGFTTFKQLRSFSHLRHVPFIITSGASVPEFIEKANALGISAYLAKPYELDDLVLTVKSFAAPAKQPSEAMTLWPSP